MKVEFKKELVPICFFYFFLFLSFGLVFPYFTLQLLTLGLSLDDAALIGGLHITFYRTRVRSLFTLVTNSLTH